MSSGTSARESAGWLRYLLEQVWQLPYQRVSSSQIAGGALAGGRARGGVGPVLASRSSSSRSGTSSNHGSPARDL